MVMWIYRTNKCRKFLGLFFATVSASIVLYRKQNHERSGRHRGKRNDRSANQRTHSGAIVTDFLGCFSGLVHIGGYVSAI